MSNYEGKISETKEQEVSDRGWSRYDIICGASHSLIPQIGTAMLNSDKVDDRGKKLGEYLQDVHDEPDDLIDKMLAAKEAEEFRSLGWNWWDGHKSKIDEIFDYIVENAEIIYSLEDEHGFNRVKCLGDAMVWLSNRPAGYPAGYLYDTYEAYSKEAYEAWRKDLKYFGTKLDELNIEDAQEVWDWMKVWSYSIWD